MYICNIEIYNLGFSSDFKGDKYNEKQGVRENVKNAYKHENKMCSAS